MNKRERNLCLYIYTPWGAHFMLKYPYPDVMVIVIGSEHS